MIYINNYQPNNQSEQFDLNFGTASNIVTVPGLGIVKYKVGAVGNPFHGLNVGGYIVNRFDYGQGVGYTGVQFAQKVTTGINTIDTWTGDKYIKIYKPNLISQIQGYRCGDVVKHQVPGVQSITRTGNATDEQVKAKWKNYALISGFSKYVHKAELGKNCWIYSAGVGRSYVIELVNALSTTGNLKLNFKITRFGVFGYKQHSETYTYDTGSAPYLSATALYSSSTFPTIRGMEKMRVMDVSSDGSKALLSVYIPPRSPIPEDNGVDDLTSGILAYCEIVMEENSTNNLAKVKTFTVKRNFTNNATTGIYYGYTPNIFASIDSKYFSNSLGKPNNYGGSPGSIYAWVGFGYNTTGSGTNKTENGIYGLLIQNATPTVRPAGDAETTSYLVGSASMFSSYTNANLIYSNAFYAVSTIAKGRYEATNANNVVTTRYIHACYDAADAISEVYVQYTNIAFDYTKCIDANGSGSGTYSTAVQPDGSTQASHSGSFSVSYTFETGKYALNMFQLFQGNNLIDELRAEVVTPASKYTRTQQWVTYTTSSGTSITIDTGAASNAARPLATTAGEATPNPQYHALPAQLTGKSIIPSIGMAYDYFANAYATKSYYRDLDVGLEDFGGKIWPFVRVETNKLVSFNIANAGYSHTVSELPTDNNNVKIFSNEVNSGQHVRKTIYNMYTKALATNTYPTIWGTGANPAINISGDNHFCSFNPATGESVINANYPVVWV